jgi:RNA polymerase sigma-70 factor (ECF subfamily)
LARERSAFERQVLPHLDAAYNLARWLVRDPATADDVVQEAMLRALRFHADLRGEAKPWLLQIVRNVAYAAMTRRNPPRAEDAADPADPADDPEAALAHRQGMQQLDRSLAALSAELRECLVLRELEELSYKEIAQVTGVAIGTVMSRLWRARQALREAAR